MCIGIPGEIVGIVEGRPNLAEVDVSGVRRSVDIGLLQDQGAEPGDWVMVHMGFAMSKLGADELTTLRSFLHQMGETPPPGEPPGWET